jgi:hypothetical protein
MQLSPRGWILVGSFAALAAAALALTGAGATAQVFTPTSSAASSAVSRLTTQSLGAHLAAQGLSATRDGERHDFTFKAVYQGQEWELTMSAVLSQNGESLWVMAWLDELPKSSADVSKAALLRLLANNDRLGKGKFFAYVAANRRFVLQRVVENQGLGAPELRDILSDLGGSVAETYPFWAAANWKNGDEAEFANQPAAPPQILRDASRETQFTPISRQ